MKVSAHRYTALLVLVLALVLSIAPGMAQESPNRARSVPTREIQVMDNAVVARDLVRNAITDSQGRLQVIVTLAEEPAVRAFINAGGRANRAAADSAARFQASRVAAQQNSFRAALPSLNAVELGRTSYVVNTVTVAVPTSQIPALLALPGVVSVVPDAIVERLDTQITDSSGAPRAWAGDFNNTSYTGRGIVVAVIDDGIDYTHAQFGGSALDFADISSRTTLGPELDGIFPAPYPVQNIGDPKIVGGWDFVGDAYDAALNPVLDPNPNPITCPESLFTAHGTSVSSFISGYGVLADGSTFTGPYNNSTLSGYPAADPAFRIGPGLAPESAVVGLRIFGCVGSTSTALIIEAINAAVAGGVDTNGDGNLDVTFPQADIINMSLGAPYGSSAPSDPRNVAIKNATDAGVIVVASAGNNSDNHFVTGTPATAEGAISVAASTQKALTVRSTVPGDDPIFYPAGVGSANPNPTLVTAPPILLEYRQACGLDPRPDLTGLIVVTEFASGVCGTLASGNSVASSGAVGFLVAIDGGIFGSSSITSMNISTRHFYGRLLDELSRPGVTITLSPNEETVDGPALDMASFSSRGPSRRSPGFTKPDLSATGTLGVAAAGGSNDGTTIFGGTSQAAPVVAGMMALLREAYPDWSVQELKALAINTAVVDLTDDVTGGPFSTIRTGTGRIDVVSAFQSQAIAYNKDFPLGVGVDFGLVEVKPNQNIVQNRTITIENKGTTPITYRADFITRVGMPGVRVVVVPDRVTVPPGQSRDIQVRLRGRPGANAGVPDPTLWRVNFGERIVQSEVSGYVRLRTPGATNLRVGVHAMPRLAANSFPPNEVTVTGVTGLGTLNFSGPGIDTGLNPPDDIVSVTTAFELVGSFAPSSSSVVVPDGDILHVGVASNPFFGDTAFALVTQGDWEPLFTNFSSILIDSTQNGVYDYEIVLCFIQPYFDVMQVCFIDLLGRFASPGTLLGLGDLPNFFGPGTINTYAHNNNVIFLPFSVYLLDLFSEDNLEPDYSPEFDFEVVTTSWDSPGFRVVGPFTHNYDAPVVSSSFTPMPFTISGNNAQLDFAYDFLSYDLDTDTPQLLLLHHHGARGQRTQVVNVNVLPTDGYVLLSPLDEEIITQPGMILPEWTDSGAAQYTFRLFKLSDNQRTPIGEVATITGTRDLFDDNIDCYAGVCSLFVNVSSLSDGTYSWTVIDSDGREASNGAFLFTIHRFDLELVRNGDMEVDANNDRVPDGWRGIRLSADRRLCNNANRTVSFTGNCAFRFRGGPGENSVLRQNLDLSRFSSNTVLELSFAVDTNRAPLNNFARVVINYTDGTRSVQNISIPDTTNGYEVITETIFINGPVANANLQFRNRQTSGRIFLDAVSLIAVGADGPPPAGPLSVPDFLPLPDAPEDFRGTGSR